MMSSPWALTLVAGFLLFMCNMSKRLKETSYEGHPLNHMQSVNPDWRSGLSIRIVGCPCPCLASGTNPLITSILQMNFKEELI